jgi:hypothetical protein
VTSESVLVNFVFCHPVGHAVEALQYCLGYRRADPQRRIGLVLTANTAVDMASWCGFIDTVYTVDVDALTRPSDDVLGHIPREWDWVVDDPRGHQQWTRDMFPGLARYYDLAAEHFTVRYGHTQVGAGLPRYQPNNRLGLTLPASALRWAAEILPDAARPTIAVMPGGGSPRWRYPSLRSWRRILGAFGERWPDCRFCLVGKLTRDGRTSTGFGRDEFDALAGDAPGTAWALDVPLAQQLAAVQRCNFLLSPHTGFAFAAMAAGTPWLVLAGNDWPEYYFNPGVPFYSVVPDVDRFPCYVALGNTPEPVADDGPRSPSMSAGRIDADLDELLDGAAWLLSGDADFDTAMRRYFGRLAEAFDGRSELIYSVDDLHLHYLPAGGSTRS